MNIKPLGDKVVIKAMVQEQKTKSGIVIPDTASKEKPQQGEVIAVGTGKIENGQKFPLEVAVGDNILFSKYAGNEVEIDGEKVLILSERDILAILG